MINLCIFKKSIIFTHTKSCRICLSCILHFCAEEMIYDWRIWTVDEDQQELPEEKKTGPKSVIFPAEL